MPYGRDAYGTPLADTYMKATQIVQGLESMRNAARQSGLQEQTAARQRKAWEREDTERATLDALDAGFSEAGGDVDAFLKLPIANKLTMDQRRTLTEWGQKRAQAKTAEESKRRLPTTLALNRGGGPTKENAGFADMAADLLGAYGIDALKHVMPEARVQPLTGYGGAAVIRGSDVDFRAYPEEIPMIPGRTGSAGGGGGTGYLVERLMEEDPNLSYAQALHIVQTGYRQGLFMQPDGSVAPMPGFGAAKGANRYQEKSGEEQAVLEKAGPIAEARQAAELAYAGPIAAAKAEGAVAGERAAGIDKQGRMLESTEVKSGTVKDAIATARKQAGFWTTGFVGNLASRVPGTEAFDLSKTIDTIKANIGFDKLQQMRNESPTGGALGQVSDRENLLLQATIANLEQSQSKPQFLRNLDTVEKQYNRSVSLLRKAYEQDLARFGRNAMPAFPFGSGQESGGGRNLPANRMAPSTPPKRLPGESPAQYLRRTRGP